ncbi:neogenin isoform X2 [Folsomia candida]|uniref:neogenin isoform X2 n=1 Tax=Folsomia candida TaxID=158441 RepID=UPI000B8EEA5C|nr:neogenin isoform X2 [Folsomia candida]
MKSSTNMTKQRQKVFSIAFTVQILILVICGIETVRSLKFILEPDDAVVPRGAGVVLNCAARGEGVLSPRISWKKDGVLLSFIGDSRRSILANGSLHITSLIRARDSRPEEGSYQCVATLDGTGTILSRFAKVQAASIVRFEEEPEDISIALGQTARFSCNAEGIPPPKISWIKDNQPLIMDDIRMSVLPSGSLEITKIRESDQGVYKCHVSNSDRQHISRTGRLVLNPNPDRDTPPSFTVIPKSRTVTALDTIILECSAVAYPLPRISWLKDGVTIDLENKHTRYSLVGEANLKITRVEEVDRGTYLCRAENREDSSDISATIDVLVPPKALPSLTNFYAYEKEDVELPCRITGRPQPPIIWRKNGETIIEGDYFQIVHGNSLKILGLVTTDAGMYQCFGANSAGNVQTGVHLQVLRPGQEMPEPEFVWDFDDELPLMDTLPPSPSSPFSSHHTGQILPTSSSATTDLSNHSPSGGPSAPRDISAVLISTRFVTLTWKAPIITNGNIIAYAIYYKEIGSDRERTRNTTTGRLEEVNIQGLQPNKRYTFRIVPYNEKSSGVSSPEIAVTTQPEVNVPGSPANLRPVLVTPTSIKLAWSQPEVSNGNIQRYKVYYVEASSKTSTSGTVKLIEEDDDTAEEDDGEIEDYLLPNNGGIQSKTVNIPEVVIEDLKIYTEYYIWVLAFNQNGPGPSSEEIKIVTLSDVPADTPHNVTVESASSTSIVVRWEPPPVEFRNGIITGYKIKYKQKKKRAETVTTDGNTLFMVMNELEKGMEYQIKLAALNLNGTGPFTEWIPAVTFERDLDETRVPLKPITIQAQASSDSITISWMPPRNQNIMIRGYTIGWGKGIPDVYTKLVEGKRRLYIIEDLQPNSDYVISVRAFNQVGDGEPIYVNERTKSTSDEEFGGGPMMAQLPPPIGLRAVILSSTSAVLYWTDSSLSRTQLATDNRYYVVRFLPTEQSSALGPKKTSPKLVNTTQMNTILDDLRPGTQYEFSVKVVKNRLSSEWSLVAINTTFSLALLAPPQDITTLAFTLADGTSSVIVNWQPPKATGEDEVKGYVVFYTTKPSLKEWVEEAVPEDVLTHRVQGLTPDTNYYFRMAAKYPKGLGLYTDIKSAATPPAKTLYGNGFGNGVRNNPYEHDIRPQDIVLYVLIGLSVLLALASIMLCIYYRRKGGSPSPNKNSSLKKSRKPDQLKPPDLWIHHDHMELKNVEKSGRHTDSLISPSSRGSREYTDLDEKIPLQCNTNSLDKKNFLSSYLVTGGGHDGRGTLTGRSVKSQILSDTSGHMSDGTKTYETTASGSSAASSQNNLHTMAQYSATSEYGTQSGGSTLGTLNRRTLSSGGTGNLKSFSVPTPPTAGYPYQPNTSQNKMNIRPMGGGVVGIHPSNDLSAQRSPKRVSTSQLPPMVVGFSKSISPRGGAGGYSSSGEASPIQKCYSTEQLNNEISNLEGLMKDLNAITASEFQC